MATDPSTSPEAVHTRERADDAQRLLRRLGITLGVCVVGALFALSLPWYRATLPPGPVLRTDGTTVVANGFDVTASGYDLYKPAAEPLPLPGVAQLPPKPPAHLAGFPALAVFLVLAGVFAGLCVWLTSPVLAGCAFIAWFLSARQLGQLRDSQAPSAILDNPSLQQAQYGQQVYDLLHYGILALCIMLAIQAAVLRQRQKAAAAAEAAAQGLAPAPSLPQRLGLGLLTSFTKLSEQNAQADAQRKLDLEKAAAARAAKEKERAKA